MTNSDVPIIDGTKGDRRYKAFIRRPPATSLTAAASGGNEKEEFRKILEEVHNLGASNLSWKERKAYENHRVATLGAKRPKGIKMPIARGLNIKRKQEKLEADKLQQDILAGFLPAKKKKRQSSGGQRVDKGLQLSEGTFKGGVLYVQKPAASNVQQERHGGDRSLNRVFNEGGPKKSGKGKKGKGGSGRGKKKGGKRKH